MKRTLSLLLAMALLMAVLPVNALAYVAETPEGLITVEDEITVLPEIQTNEAITEDIYNRYYFDNLEDLKDLAGRTYDNYSTANYRGTEELVITGELTLPEKLSLYVQDLRIAEGAVFTTSSSTDVDTLTVEGTMYSDYLSVAKELTVTGQLHTEGTTVLENGAVLNGEENITLGPWNTIVRDVYVTTMEELKAAIAVVETIDTNKFRHDITLTQEYVYGQERNFVIDESLTFPEGCHVDTSLTSLTIAEGCTVTITEYANFDCHLIVNGTLLLPEYQEIYMYRRESAALTVGENGKIRGKLKIQYGENCTIDTLIPNNDHSDFHITPADTQYSKYYIVQHVKGMTQLATATNLRWGYTHDWVEDPATGEYVQVDVERPGHVTFDIGTPNQGNLEFAVYKEGDDAYPYYSMGMRYNSMQEAQSYALDFFAISEKLESGTYYFTIVSQGDGVQYYDSDVAKSGTWTYVRPDTQLPAPTPLRWEGRNAIIQAPADKTNIGGYAFDFLFAKTLEEEPSMWGGTKSLYNGDQEYPQGYLFDWMLQNCGEGYYYFKARTLADDINVSYNSEWSELSQPLYLKNAVAELDTILQDASSKTKAEIQNAVQSIGAASLETAMLTDKQNTGAVAQISKLEEAIGGPAEVKVADAASAFDASKISVVGAALNTAANASQDIALVVDKPEKQHVIPEAYNNSVAVRFSMDLENVSNTEELAVPVQITLPVPANINPDFLVILHYRADGSVEELAMPYIYEEDGQTYARFVVNGFSDFVLTQYKTGDDEEETCTHSFGDWETTKDATCTAEGTKERTCSLCNEKETDTIPVKGHTEVIDEAVAATCTKPGKTEGKHCSVCNEILTAQTETTALGHTEVIDEAVAATCTKPGKTEGKHCSVCKEVIVAQTTVDTLEHNYENGTCTLCGYSTNTYVPVTDKVGRIFGSGRCETARKVADAMKTELGIEKFDAILYTSAMNFADALAGSYLSAVKNAPILLYLGNGTDPQANLEYIRNNLADGGTVYILGGNTAVPETVDDALAELGIKAQRVAGAQRFQTNIEILKASGFSGNSTVLVCTAMNFADSLSASATGLPILLVYDKWTELSDEYKDYLKDFSGLNFVVVGGKNAVSEALEASLSAYGTVEERLAGATRYETSTMVAEKFFDAPESAVLAYALNFPDGLCGGALAYAKGSPLILTNTGATAKAETYVQGKGIETGTVLGGAGLISDEAAEEVFGYFAVSDGEYGSNTPDD